MPLHKNLGSAEVHIPYTFEFPNAAARIGSLGYLPGDVGKLARQTDDNTFWILVGVAPLWKELTTSGHGSQHKGDGLDPVPVATVTVAGLLSAADKVKIDTFAQNSVIVDVRNETGSMIPKGTLVAPVGFSGGKVLVAPADKDTAGLRPTIGTTVNDVANNSDANVVAQGTLTGINTTAFSLRDQLVLGTSGAFTRPPPENGGFTAGEVQNVGVVARVHATEGVIIVSVDGMVPGSAGTILASQGTSGTPSDSNRYVTDGDARNTNARAPTAHAGTHVPSGSDPLATAVPVDTGTANSEGTATTLARSDHVHRGAFLQTLFTEITADVSTTSTTFVTLLTQAITIQAGSILLAEFTASASNSGNGNNVLFRITIDGTPYRGAAMTSSGAGAPGGAAIQLRVPGLAAGARTVLVEWRVNAATGRVRPVAAPDAESASLGLTEVRV